MTVEYKESEQGVFWVDGDQQGEPQKDLRHAMDDYELTISGRKEQQRDSEERVHTGDDGGPVEGDAGPVADNAGSAGETEAASGQGGSSQARGSRAGGGGKNDPNPGSGASGSAG